MKSFIRHMYILLHSAAVWIVAAVVLHSCADNTDVLPEYEDEDYSLGLQLVFENISALSGTPDGDYDDGRATAYENYIDIGNGDFRFYFFSGDDSYIGPIRISSLIPLSGEPLQSSKIYEAMGAIEAELSSCTSFKVCVLANWKTYPELKVGDPLSKLWDSMDENICNYTGTLSAENTIPLYGIREYDDFTLTPNRFTSLGRINLLRAFAKVEVDFDETVPAVTSISLTRVNSTGFKAPAEVTVEGDYVHGSYDDDYVDTPHIPDNTNVLEDVAIPIVYGAATDSFALRRYVIYVPEYDNISSGATPASIKIELAGYDFAHSIDFKYYSGDRENMPFDILRNYWYHFSVYMCDIDLKLHLDVLPYISVPLEPSAGLEMDSYGNYVDKAGNAVLSDGNRLLFLLSKKDGKIIPAAGVEMTSRGTDAETGSELWNVEITSSPKRTYFFSRLTKTVDVVHPTTGEMVTATCYMYIVMDNDKDLNAISTAQFNIYP